MSATPTYDGLCAHWQRLHRFEHALCFVDLDRNTHMPPGGNAARGAALAELQSHIHALTTQPDLGPRLQTAQAEPLDEAAQANWREMHRAWFDANALPATLVERRAGAAARCEHAWRTQRAANDWAGFLGNFREIVAIALEEAQYLADAQGLSRYDALLERFEPGMRAVRLDALFGELQSWLPAMVTQAVARQAAAPAIDPVGPFPLAAQRALGLDLMALLGFDLDAGRLDVSAHPFCGGVPEDVRITTRYNEADALSSVMSVIHETGHARYEQNLPRALLGLPVARARSAALHESQSLAFEMQLARSPGFVHLLAPLLRRHLGDQPAFADANLLRLLQRVAPGLIRVEADELTYPLHVILRYEIERALIEGEIEADDVPAWWSGRMRDWLGLDTRSDFRNGCLQDVHWSEGLFGYFPSYTLGAMYAAQWFAALRRALPDLDDRVAAGELAPVFDWLRENIWAQGSRWTTDELCVRAIGSPLDAAHFRAHLENRYLGA